jgi:hypothetical protein
MIWLIISGLVSLAALAALLAVALCRAADVPHLPPEGLEESAHPLGNVTVIRPGRSDRGART